MVNSFPIIDADAHVIETEHTWDYLEESERKFRPRLYSTPEDPTPRSLCVAVGTVGWPISQRKAVAVCFIPASCRP